MSTLQEALNTGDAALVALALKQGNAPSADHLQELLDHPSPSTPGLLRLLIQYGANPHAGAPSAIQTAQRRQLFSLAWTMEAAWQATQALAGSP